VNPLPLLRVPDNSRDCSECLSFAGLHFRDFSFGQGHGALNLYVEHDEAQDSRCDNRSYSYGFDQVPGSPSRLPQRFVTDIRQLIAALDDPADFVLGRTRI
jgi:hypothetical protein